MTKAELEKYNNFLLLQLKRINQLAKDTHGKDRSEVFYIIGQIDYISNTDNTKEGFNFIKEHNKSYNFFTPEINIDNYKL